MLILLYLLLATTGWKSLIDRYLSVHACMFAFMLYIQAESVPPRTSNDMIAERVLNNVIGQECATREVVI